MNTFKLMAFSSMVAMGGLPLYLHLPHYASTELEIGVGQLGLVLLAFRLLDMVQDPLLGRILDLHASNIGLISVCSAGLMAAGFIGVFALPLAKQLPWLALFAGLLFTGYSLLNILLYRQSSLLQETTMPNAARIRELGLMIGVIVGALLPFAFSFAGFNAYLAYGLILAVFAILASIIAFSLWSIETKNDRPVTFRQLREIGALKILLLAFLNTLPVAITSTLFLFFVSDRLNLANYAGLFSALFFCAIMLGVIVFSQLYKTVSARNLLLFSMTGAIFSFIWAYTLPVGASLPFGVISIASGFFLGAEIYLLPVIFARLLTNHQLATGVAFGVWSFLTKLALAIAAGVVLPLLTLAGYVADGLSSPQALTMLAAFYALVPCILKLASLMLVYLSPEEVR